MFRHVVLFRIHDDVSESRVHEAVDLLRSLGQLPCVSGWVIARSLDERKGRIIIQDATFLNLATFEQFRMHARHAAVGHRMSQISDWWIADFESAR